MEESLKYIVIELLNNTIYLRRLFFLMNYNGFLDANCNFIIRDPLYCSIEDNEIKKEILNFFETTDYNQRIKKFFLAIVCAGIDNNYYDLVNKYK